MDTFALLQDLVTAAGVSGHEEEARRAVRAAFEPFADSLDVDALGNLVATRKGSGGPDAPAILLACHMDEIGLMVTQIEAGGFLRFTTVGGWDPRMMLAQPVEVRGKRALPGIVGSRPPHVLPPATRTKPLPVDQLFIDVGLPEEEVRELVRVGDVVRTRREPIKLLGGRVASKIMDNRASVAAVALALEALSKREHHWNVLAVATVQEEIGLSGAMTSGWHLAPAAGIAIDVSFAKQHGTSKADAELGGGPMIAFGPNVHPAMHQALVDAAGRLEMKQVVEPLAGATGTDAWALQVAGSGIPTGLVSIPLRYMHSTVETLDLADVERTGRLLAETIAGLDASFAAGLVEDLSDLESPGDAA